PTSSTSPPRISSPRPDGRRRCPRGSWRRSRSFGLVALFFSILLLVVGCASSDSKGSAPVRRKAVAPNAFLLAPNDGWTGALDDAQRDALLAGFEALSREGDTAAALAAADALRGPPPRRPPRGRTRGGPIPPISRRRWSSPPKPS